MRLSHVIARIEQQFVLNDLILNAFDNLITVGPINLTSSRIKMRLNVLEENWQKFTVTHDAIGIAIQELSLEERTQLKGHLYFTNNLFSTTHECYLSNVEKMQSLLDSQSEPGTIQEITSQQMPNTSSSTTPTCFHQARLPRIDLPKFNGNQSDWMSFKDLFSSLVLSNPTLTEVGKLQYLKTSLTGSAAHLLKNTTLTADNFQKSWDALISYYENTRLLVNAALHSLLSIKRMTKESASELEQLYTTMLQIYRSLETLKRPVSMWDDFLVFIATQRLDSESVKAWEHHLGPTRDPPTWIQLCDFLVTRLRSLQAYEKSRTGKLNTETNSKTNSKTFKSCYQGKDKENKFVNTISCSICSEKHYTASCPQYMSKTRNQKLSVISKNRLCFNCLGSHRASNCKSTRRCQKCGKKHHTTIHSDTNQSAKTELDKSSSEKSTSLENTTAKPSEARIHSNIIPNSFRFHILLATAQVRVLSPNGSITRARALIDQGSEVSLVTERLAQRLKLPRLHSTVTFVGLGAQPSNKSKGLVNLKIKPYFNSNFESTIFAHILPSLTSSLPSSEISKESWPHLKGLQLADPHFSLPGSIDILIGADIYGQIIKDRLIKGQANSPIAQNTKHKFRLDYLWSNSRKYFSATISKLSCITERRTL